MPKTNEDWVDGGKETIYKKDSKTSGHRQQALLASERAQGNREAALWPAYSPIVTIARDQISTITSFPLTRWPNRLTRGRNTTPQENIFLSNRIILLLTRPGL
jgi:hypothetical protein